MTTIAVVGLGYVGLPLAVEFGKKFRTIGFDLSAEKIACYKKHYDPTGRSQHRRSKRPPCWRLARMPCLAGSRLCRGCRADAGR